MDSLKFNFSEIEEKVVGGEDVYQGLNPEALYTSLEDLENLLSLPETRGTWVDLGCGVGQSVLFHGIKYPEEKSIGIEISESRVLAGQKRARELSLSNVDLRIGNLLCDEIPNGDCYFLYFPTGPVLDRILCELSKKDRDFHLIVIESHGDLLERIKLEGWLEVINEIPLVSARHYPNAVVFKASQNERSDLASFMDLSFQDQLLEIEDETGAWLGDSSGMTLYKNGVVNLLHPPRTVEQRFIKNALYKEGLSSEIHHALRLRRLGEVSIHYDLKKCVGVIRKIYHRDGLSVEISSGEKIEWSRINAIYHREVLCYASSSYRSSLPAV